MLIENNTVKGNHW